jgi:acyl-CoA thioester hydrolase
MSKFQTTLLTQWGDQDAFGHINNVQFFRYFETARIRMLEQAGIERFDALPEFPVVVNLTLNYRSQLKYPEKLTASLWISDLKSRTSIINIEMHEETSQRLVAEGSATLVWIDKKTGRAVAIPDGIRQKLAP